jgi:FkbM family methyltransferase
MLLFKSYWSFIARARAPWPLGLPRWAAMSLPSTTTLMGSRRCVEGVLRLPGMFESVIPRLLGLTPVSWRRVILGHPADPSRVASFLHDLLNRLSPSQSQAFECYGPLKGYRMYIDWNRFRSFLYGTWEPNVVRAVTSTVKPGMSVVDIGAHIGYYTLLLAKCVGLSGSIASFEPLPANFLSLQKNVQLNRLQNVQTFPEALSSQNQEVTINVPRGLTNTGDASICRIDGAEQLRVRAISLDSFCGSSGFRPDFLKMDVEGAEYDVLIGGHSVITRFRPKMLIELHHFDGNLAIHPVPGLLAEWAYDIQWLDRWDMTSHILATPRLRVAPISPNSSDESVTVF